MEEVRKCRDCNAAPEVSRANCADCARKVLQRLNDRWPGFAPCLICYKVHRGRCVPFAVTWGEPYKLALRPGPVRI